MGFPEGDIDIITEGQKNAVMGPEPGHIKDMAPGLNSPLPAFICFGDINGFSGRAAGLSEGGHLFDIASQKPSIREGLHLLIFPHLLFFSEGNLLEVVKRPDITPIHSFQLFPIEGGMLLRKGEHLPKV